MNALQLVNELLSRFALTEVSAFTDSTDATIALRKINLTIKNITLMFPWTWAEKTEAGAITLVEGQGKYALASDVAFLTAATVKYQDGTPVDIVDRATLERYRPVRNDATQYDIPRFITMAGQTLSGGVYLKNVELWPQPNSVVAGSLLNYWYTMIATDMTLETDVSIIPADFDSVILDLSELLWRRGPLRTGGDQNQIDLFQAAQTGGTDGINKLLARESNLTGQTMIWDIDSPDI